MVRPGWAVVALVAAWAASLTPAQAQRSENEIAAELISRLDANRDGTLDRAEIPARSRPGVEKLAGEAGLDATKPLPVADLRQYLMRSEQGDQGNDGRGGGPQGEDRRRRRFDRGGGGEQDNSNAESDRRRDRRGPPERGAPGGSDRESARAGSTSGAASPARPQGFGGSGGAGGPLEARYDERVIRFAERMLSRYDRDGSGSLERAEWEGMRWSSDPSAADTNKDGVLSKAELAERLASREGGPREGPGRDGPGGFNRGDGPPGPPGDNSARPGPTRDGGGFGDRRPPDSAGASGGSGGDAERVRRYAEGLLRRYDENRSGVLEKEEWGRMRGNPAESDSNRDGKLTLDELAGRLGAYGRGTTTASAAAERPSQALTGRGDRATRTSDSSRSDPGNARRSYRFLTPAERLSGSLPASLRGWFLERDRDGDGQIAMSEFTSSWSQEKVTEFSALDQNQDGLITPQEYLDAKNKD